MDYNHLACGTPMRKNRFGELDCPKCSSEKFVGFPPAKKTRTFIPLEKLSHDEIIDSESVKDTTVMILIEDD